ncbi:MAG: tetratricopeptide repeat protein [Minwuia sp.]|nr:tetratricopeptide repeat protein [Minwuia sp.]
MAHYQDQWGNPVTASGDDAVTALDRTIMAYLGFRLDTGNHLKDALKADPEMPLALIYSGFFFLLFCHPKMHAKGLAARDHAAMVVAATDVSSRERQCMAALDAWADGDWHRAAAAFENILLDHPLDAMALRLSHYLHFYLDGGRAMRLSSARVLPFWTMDQPGAGYVQAIHAFGLEENGEYAAAERHARAAIEINPSDLWGIHAGAHVMEMQGRHRDGIGWISAQADNWASGTNNFRFHVWWHRALFHLELGEHATVLDLYDREIRAESTEEYLDITNGTALLWRLEQHGVNVGDRWVELADRSAERVGDHLLCFADLHYAMAFGATGRAADSQALLDAMRRGNVDETCAQGTVYRQVGIALSEAMIDARAGLHDRVVDVLLPLRHQFALVGGSHAQRDIFERVLLESALAAGRSTLARSLAAERIDQKPTSPYNWQAHARALELAGDADAAASAMQRATVLAA